MQEPHKELMAGKGVLLVTGDAVEGCDPIRVTEPYSIVALFHNQPRSLIDQIHLNYKQTGLQIVYTFQIRRHGN